ncbi:hypothetical protein AB6A40_001868 [Gnathostoma spinigerum]|uniref:Malonyl-CoA:ACP transacylase (MAT) domain-containing protein n=1 Tax=Gnathostoma spinigerum TaxID=75299 RepID=A0ABD6EAK2_9BILA
MNRYWKPFLISIRGIRQRTSKTPRSEKTKTAEWLNDATTFADTHAVILDPYTSLPYPDKDIKNFLEESEAASKAAIKERIAKKHIKKKIHRLNFDHIPIENQVFILFPGQGSQFVGMGKKILDCKRSEEMFDKASSILGYDLKKLCLEGPKTKLDQTIYCQPAVFVTSLAALEKAREKDVDLVNRVTETAGFSVGEYSSLVLAGVISFEDALKIVNVRAKAMHDCNQLIASGMLTVRVSASSRLDEAMKEAKKVAREKNEREICDVANYLYCGLKVIGASETCIHYLTEHQEEYRFQVIKRLPVSGAFHTYLMKDAAEPLKGALKGIVLSPPRINVYSNYTGKLHGRRAGEIRENLIKQLYSPVKWEQIMQLMYRQHQDNKFPTFAEIGPGRQLGAMLLRVSKKAYGNYENHAV